MLAPRLYTASLVAGAPPPASGVLLASLCIFCAEALWWLRRCGAPARGVGGRDCRGACAAITAAAAEISAVAFAVGFRPDLAAWFIPLGTALALAAVTLTPNPHAQPCLPQQCPTRT